MGFKWDKRDKRDKWDKWDSSGTSGIGETARTRAASLAPARPRARKKEPCAPARPRARKKEPCARRTLAPARPRARKKVALRACKAASAEEGAVRACKAASAEEGAASTVRAAGSKPQPPSPSHTRPPCPSLTPPPRAVHRTKVQGPHPATNEESLMTCSGTRSGPERRLGRAEWRRQARRGTGGGGCATSARQPTRPYDVNRARKPSEAEWSRAPGV